jgi:primosomal protein N' (replication factor Y)
MAKYQSESLFESDQPPLSAAARIVRLAFDTGTDNEFDYLVPDDLWPIQPGQRVQAPFGPKNKQQVGFCIAADIPPDQSFTARGKGRTLKKIAKVLDTHPLLDPPMLQLARWMSAYYVCPLGQTLAAMVPAGVKKGAGAKTQKSIYLAADPASARTICQQLKSQKQRRIISHLLESSAFDADSALEHQALCRAAACSDVPLKRLAEKGILKAVQRTVLKSLPAIPEGMALKTETVTLNPDQQKALEHFTLHIDTPGFGVTLLYGVTDSGKTEIYIRAIEHAIRIGKTAIVLLPEIALTTQTIQRFSARFQKIAVLHSGLTASQRNVEWHKIKQGNADVVIGARSAVFAPIPRLGLIVVDEEHESGYKQDIVPRYHARDVAIKRAHIENAHCILGSATPSLETLYNCRTKKHFYLVTLPKRVMHLPMPEMKLVDMSRFPTSHQAVNLISPPLAQQLRTVLDRKEQAILLLNRRGYSNFVFCPSCKHTLRCRNCDVTLSFHKADIPQAPSVRTVTGKHIDYGFALCHYCLAQTLVPENCPVCGKRMAMIGTGSQRLEEELARKFPLARVARIDSDSMEGKDYYQLLTMFSQGQIDILAGTQMLAKGLHFPGVTLVGIISADTSLYVPDFRANERTFQLISQVAGRAGRSEKKGIVFIQTFLPNQPPIQFALKNDFPGFVAQELKHRRSCNLPPFWRLAVIVARDTDFEKLESACRGLRQRIDDIVAANNLQVLVRGPLPAVISRIQRFHRMQIIIQAPTPDIIHRIFDAFRKGPPVRPAVKLAIDIDPTNLL